MLVCSCDSQQNNIAYILVTSFDSQQIVWQNNIAHTHELLWLSAKQYRSYIYSSSYDWSKTIQLILVSSYDSQQSNILVVAQYLLTDITDKAKQARKWGHF